MKSLDLFQLDGKLALVTGGCGNLGPFWVRALLEAGSMVAVVDFKNTPVSKIYRILPKKFAKKLRFYQADITDIKNLSKVHKSINKDLGQISILVNNAGIDTPPVKVEKKQESKVLIEKYKKMWDVNVQGLVNCLEEFVPDMKKKKLGSIINIGSLYLERAPDERFYNHLGFDKPWAYGATKAAVDQVTRHYATRLAKYGIRVNTLSPGGVFNNQDKEFVRKYSLRVPLGRMANKETDLGGPLIFLASNASSYVTGINLEVNGGFTTW